VWVPVAVRIVVGVTLLAAAASARAAEPVIVDVGALPDADRPSLEALARHRALELASPQASDVPSRDALLGEARRSYGNMSFARAVGELSRAETRLIGQARVAPERTARLAELELFLGACQLLEHDSHSAEERFVLARALAPQLAPDPIFPPEVGRAFRTARPGPQLTINATIAPVGARLWVDGVEGVPKELTTGLHYLAVERADRRPTGRLVRISRSSAQLTLAADAPAERDGALLALRTTSDAREALDVSRLLGASIWRLTAREQVIVAERFAATDAVRPTLSVEVPVNDPAALDRAICTVDVCEPPVAAATRRPVWRRPWFWTVVGVGAAAVVAGIVAGAVVATRPRDYEVVVR
jgi:hypothetical protein